MGKRSLATIAVLVLAGLGLGLNLGVSRSGAQAGTGAIAYSAHDDAEVDYLPAFGGRPRVIGPGLLVGISPDGQTVAVLGSERGQTERGLFLVNTATGVATFLTNNSGLSVQWAPDSSRLLVEQDGLANGSSQLLMCTRAPARCHAIARGEINGFAFSPDSRSIAYGNLLSTGTSTGQVVILSPDGTLQVLGTYDTVSLWAPAGLILTEIANGGPQTFWLKRSDGTSSRLFTARPGLPYLNPVDVSPDGSTILYESLVACPPLQPSADAETCIPTAAVIETGSITGGAPHPASTHYSQAGTAHFATNNSVIAAYSTATTHGAPNAYYSPLTYIRAPIYLGEQRLEPAGSSPPPPTLSTERTTRVALAR